MTGSITPILLVGIVSAVAAIGAWRAARQSSVATTTLAAIEQHRWYSDLTPRFDVHVSRGPMGERARLTVSLVGPPGLDRLDELLVTIRDDTRDHLPNPILDVTAEQIRQQVWGPYRLVPGVDGADPNGRKVGPVTMLTGDGRPFDLERTRPPAWVDDQFWTRTYDQTPIRLTLSCRRTPHPPWTVPIEVSVAEEP